MRHSTKSLAFLNRQFMNKREQKIHILSYKIIRMATFSLYKTHKTNHKHFIIHHFVCRAACLILLYFVQTQVRTASSTSFIYYPYFWEDISVL